MGREGARSTYQKEVCGIDAESTVVAAPASEVRLSKGERLEVAIGNRSDPVDFATFRLLSLRRLIRLRSSRGP